MGFKIPSFNTLLLKTDFKNILLKNGSVNTPSKLFLKGFQRIV